MSRHALRCSCWRSTDRECFSPRAEIACARCVFPMPAEAKKVTRMRPPKIGETLARAAYPSLCGVLLLAPEIAAAQSLTVPGLEIRIDCGAARPAQRALALFPPRLLTVISRSYGV